MSVSVVSLIAMFITLSICVFVPIITLVIYAIINRGKGVWLAWLLGAAGFFVMQIVIRTPIISLAASLPKFQQWTIKYYFLYVFILAVTAALFEVVARYAVAKILKKKRCYAVAVGAGLGHGGIEAIVLIGGTYVNNIIYSILINTGNFRPMVMSMSDLGVDIEQFRTIEMQLIGTPSGTFLLAGYERILTMIIHIALTVMVFYFVHKGKDFIGILLCFLCHATIDFVPGLIQGLTVYNRMATIHLSDTVLYIIIYTFLTFVAIIALVITFIIRHLWLKEAKLQK